MLRPSASDGVSPTVELSCLQSSQKRVLVYSLLEYLTRASLFMHMSYLPTIGLIVKRVIHYEHQCRTKLHNTVHTVPYSLDHSSIISHDLCALPVTTDTILS